MAKREIEKLGLDSIGFTFYWTCCLGSNFNLDYEASFARIVVPTWWTQEFNQAFSVYASTGQRIVPPNLTNERDRDFFLRQYGVEPFSDGRGYVFLSSTHELNIVLDELKGRPRKRGRVGRKPIYSDRLAVMCAAWKDMKHMKDEDIEKEVDKELYNEAALQDSMADIKHLIRRGRKLAVDSEKHNRSFPEFLPDSAEQIAESIDRTGLRGKLEQAFAAAIARVRQCRDKASDLPTDETKEVDS